MKDFKLELNHREFHKEFVPKEHADNLFNLLKSEIPWRQVNYYKKTATKMLLRQD